MSFGLECTINNFSNGGSKKFFLPLKWITDPTGASWQTVIDSETLVQDIVMNSLHPLMDFLNDQCGYVSLRIDGIDPYKTFTAIAYEIRDEQINFKLDIYNIDCNLQN